MNFSKGIQAKKDLAIMHYSGLKCTAWNICKERKADIVKNDSWNVPFQNGDSYKIQAKVWNFSND